MNWFHDTCIVFYTVLYVKVTIYVQSSQESFFMPDDTNLGSAISFLKFPENLIFTQTFKNKLKDKTDHLRLFYTSQLQYVQIFNWVTLLMFHNYIV